MLVALFLFTILGVWAIIKLVLGMVGAGMFTGAIAEVDESDAEKVADNLKGCWASFKLFSGGAVQLVIAVIGIIATTW